MNTASIPVNIKTIASGEMGIDQTVQVMKQMILASLGKQQVRITAEDIIGHVPSNDRMGEARAIYEFVRDKIRYTKDPSGMEYVQTPNHLLEMIHTRGQAYGDCDDKTVLGLSLLKNIGFPVAIRTVSYMPHRQFTHVYGLVKVDNTWLPFDATPVDEELGWEYKPTTRIKDYQLGAYGWDMEELAGLDGKFKEIDWDRIINNAIGTLAGSLLVLYVIGRGKR